MCLFTLKTGCKIQNFLVALILNFTAFDLVLVSVMRIIRTKKKKKKKKDKKKKKKKKKEFSL